MKSDLMRMEWVSIARTTSETPQIWRWSLASASESVPPLYRFREYITEVEYKTKCRQFCGVQFKTLAAV